MGFGSAPGLHLRRGHARGFSLERSNALGFCRSDPFGFGSGQCGTLALRGCRLLGLGRSCAFGCSSGCSCALDFGSRHPLSFGSDPLGALALSGRRSLDLGLGRCQPFAFRLGGSGTRGVGLRGGEPFGLCLGLRLTLQLCRSSRSFGFGLRGQFALEHAPLYGLSLSEGGSCIDGLLPGGLDLAARARTPPQMEPSCGQPAYGQSSQQQKQRLVHKGVTQPL
jgi:hypothetical protein